MAYNYDNLDRVTEVEYNVNGNRLAISNEYEYSTDATYGTSGRINAYTSGKRALVTSSITAFIGYASDMAVSEGMMSEYTFGFGEAVKVFFGWVDDALVYIWE